MVIAGLEEWILEAFFDMVAEVLEVEA